MATDKGRQSKIILGLNVQGDIGPMTFYTNKNGKLVAFLRAPPLNPPSATQEIMRDFIRACSTNWRALGAVQRGAWNRLARKCNLSISGFNTWVWYSRTRDESALRTLEHQSGESVTRP